MKILEILLTYFGSIYNGLHWIYLLCEDILDIQNIYNRKEYFIYNFILILLGIPLLYFFYGFNNLIFWIVSVIIGYLFYYGYASRYNDSFIDNHYNNLFLHLIFFPFIFILLFFLKSNISNN